MKNEENRNELVAVIENSLVIGTVESVYMGRTLIASIALWLKHQFFSSTFLKFIVAGGFAAIVNFSSRIGLSVFLDYATAIVVAYLIGMLTAFILNRLFVFQTRSNKTARQLFYFTLVNLFAILQTLVVSLLLARIVLPSMGIDHWVEEIAHLVGIGVPVFTSFLGHKYWSFNK
jgi:putative flippase GtrA